MPPPSAPTSPAVLALALVQAVARLARAPARERAALAAALPFVDVGGASPDVAQRIMRWLRLAGSLREQPFDHAVFWSLAQALIEEGLWDDALFAVDRAIELAEPSADYQVARGDVLERLERFFEAGQAFRAALALDPHHAAAHLRTAVAECRVGRDDAALSHLYHAVQRAPDLAIGWLDIARLEERRGALDEAQTALIRFRALAPTDPRGAVVEVGLLMARGDRAGALALGTVEMSQLGAGPDLLVNTALAALALGKLPEAEGLLERALAQVPDHVAALVALGVVERRRGHTAKSISYFEKALNMEPGCTEALLNLGLARARTGQPGAALSLIERALAREPALVGALLARAELTAESAPAAALADLTRVCELAPEEARAWTNRAALELAAGRAVEALASADRALLVMPGITEALVTQGRAREALGDLTGAEASYRASVAGDPDAALHLADLLERTGRLADVPLTLASARALHPESVLLARAAARAARELGQPEAAVAITREALALAPGDADVVLAHVRSLLAAREHGQARAFVDAHALAHPDDPAALVARGLVLVQLEDHDGAVVALSTALELDAHAPEALSLIVVALRASGRAAEADELVRLAVARDPGATEALELAQQPARAPERRRDAAVLQQALDLDRAGDLAAALPLYEEALVAGNPDVWLNIGLLHRKRLDGEAELAAYDSAREAGVAPELVALLAAQALALAGRPRRALLALAKADLTDPLAAALAGSLALLTGDAPRGAALLAQARAASPADPDVARNLAFACLFTGAAAEGLEHLERLEPDASGGDWLLRVALTEAAHGPRAALELTGAALEDERLARSDRFLMFVALGNLAAPDYPADALQAYLTATTLTEASPRYLLTNLGRLLAGGARPVIQTLRALANVSGPETAALALAARAAEGAGAERIDNRALVWLLRAEVGLKFPTRWLFP